MVIFGKDEENNVYPFSFLFERNIGNIGIDSKPVKLSGKRI